LVTSWNWSLDAADARSRLAQGRKVKQGKLLTGRVPIGTRVVGPRGRRRVVPDEGELAIMRDIVRMRDEERLTFRRIWLALMARRAKTREGKLWTKTRVHRAYRAAKQQAQAGRGAVVVGQEARSEAGTGAATAPAGSGGVGGQAERT